MRIKTNWAALLMAVTFSAQALGQYVIEDEGVGLTAQELEYIVQYWTPQMQEAAAIDLGDRFELLNMAMANKKIALEAKKVTPEEDPKRYWVNQLILRNTERKFVVDNYMANLRIPDMSALAEERYLTNPDKYGLVPETRQVSHILLRCQYPECDRDTRRPEAQEILEQVRAGADFEELARKYSEDPGSRKKGGKFDKWLQKSSTDVEPYFLQSALAMNEVGEVSELVDSNFGIHIIRLDAVREKSHKPYAEVKDVIIADLKHEYKKLAAKEFDARFRLTDDTYIDKAAMDKVFAPYQPKDITSEQ